MSLWNVNYYQILLILVSINFFVSEMHKDVICNQFLLLRLEYEYHITYSLRSNKSTHLVWKCTSSFECDLKDVP